MGWVVNTTPRSIYPRERPSTHCIGGWVGLWVSLDGCGKYHLPLGFDSRNVLPEVSRYTDCMYTDNDVCVCVWGGGGCNRIQTSYVRICLKEIRWYLGRGFTLICFGLIKYWPHRAMRWNIFIDISVINRPYWRSYFVVFFNISRMRQTCL